jgi:hypothetical protein
MQNFFSTIGFLVTSFLFGAGFFIMLGRKDAGRPPEAPLEGLTENAMEMPASESTAPLTYGYKESKGKKRKADSRGIEQDVRQEKKDLKSLYGNSSFIQDVVKEWKAPVREAAEMYSIRANLLLAHVIVQTFLNPDYNDRAFQRDLRAHAGETATSAEKALRNYPSGWSVGYLADKYDLQRYFPAKAEKKTAFASAAPTVTKKAAAPDRRPEAVVAPREAGLRELVAKQYGYDSWAQLCKKADRSTRTQAESKIGTLKHAMTIR